MNVRIQGKYSRMPQQWEKFLCLRQVFCSNFGPLWLQHFLQQQYWLLSVRMHHWQLCPVGCKHRLQKCKMNLVFSCIGFAKGCLDINECEDPASCGPNTFCTNSIGSFFCACLPGYELWAAGQGCSDIDECQHPDWRQNKGWHVYNLWLRREVRGC